MHYCTAPLGRFLAVSIISALFGREVRPKHNLRSPSRWRRSKRYDNLQLAHLDYEREVDAYSQVGRSEHVAARHLEKVEKLHEMIKPECRVAEADHLGHSALCHQIDEAAASRSVAQEEIRK